MDNALTFGVGHSGSGDQTNYVPVALIPLTTDLVQISPQASDPSQFIAAASLGMAFGGLVAGDPVWNRIRGANVFNSVLATASGFTTVWNPGGDTPRVLGFTISVAGTLATTGVLTVSIAEDSNVFWRGLATVSDTTPVGDTQMGCDYGLVGRLCASESLVRVQLSAAMLTGGVTVNMWGTQEP